MRLTLLIIACGYTCAGQDPDLLQQGARAMREGRFAEAETIYRRLLKSAPQDVRLHLNLGLALHSEGKLEQALPEIERYLKATPQPGPVHLLQGTMRLKLKKPCEAIAPLEVARQWQASVEVLTELGDAYSGCKRYHDAGKTYEQAGRVRGLDPKLHRAAGHAFWEAREYQQSVKLFAAVESSFANDAEFLYEYGDTLTRLEGASAGLQYLERAVAAQHSLLPARAALGKALVEVGRHQDAISHLEAATATDPAIWLALSKAYRATGRNADAARATAEYRKRMADAQN